MFTEILQSERVFEGWKKNSPYLWGFLYKAHKLKPMSNQAWPNSQNKLSLIDESISDKLVAKMPRVNNN
jgi:hypothetical protein